MTETIKNMDSLFKEKEKEFYNRHLKKIYKGRIAKASDLKYSLEEYEKQFRFETEFPIEINDYFKEFISFFESHNRLGHSLNSSIRLLRKGNYKIADDSSFISEPNNSPTDEIQFVKKTKTKNTSLFPSNTDIKKVKSKWDKHFSQLTDDELITEYAIWKAKKRFHLFLDTELAKLQSTESTNDIERPEIAIIKNKDNTTRRQALAIYYLDSYCKFNMGKEIALARFIQFLTDKNLDNIVKVLRNPLKISDKKKVKADEELIKDLKYIRTYFEELGLTGILKLIDKDITAISK